jgi:alginate O-acetyltransferase complex protein AlgI
MVFSSLFFLFVFLPVVLAAYYLVPKRFRNACLFVFSLVFYAWGEPVYILLMLFFILFGFAAGRALEAAKTRRAKKAALAGSVCVDLGLLAFFKYAGLFADTVGRLTGRSVPLPQAALPIGISFYTFESISYVVDLYRGDAPAQKNLVDFGTYLSLFPHLIAGPIIRYRDFAPQLRNRKESLENFAEGCRRFSLGLFKKVLLADQLAQLADRVRYFGAPSALSAWLGALAFTFQIYFDFSGYSDMAIGLGLMFGFTLPENFNLPYLSQNASKFWRRWHMTLGGWFREYLYIPLGGNRCSVLKNVRNLAVVWVLTGLWHGASWNFAFWGGYWGLLIICEKLFFQKWLDRIPAFFRWLYAFLAAAVGWVFFSNTDLSAAFRTVGAMFGFAPGTDRLGLYSLATFGPVLVIAALGCSPLPAKLSRKLREGGRVGRIVWCAGFVGCFVAAVAFAAAGSYSPFLYFRF